MTDHAPRNELTAVGQPSSAFFISAAPLRLFVPSQPVAKSPRRPPVMGTTPPPPSDGSDGLYRRFREFTSGDGDSSLQEELAREVMWQAARTATTETMESAIRGELDAVSDLLADMYTRSERELRLRQEELAMRTSLPNISKWNQQLIEGHKMSKIHRSEIDKELAIVDAMLRRNQKERNRGRRKRRARTANTRRLEEASGDVTQKSGAISWGLRELLVAPSKPARFAFTLFVCITAIESFEKVAAQDNGPSHLAKYAALSALAVLLTAHLSAMRSAVADANTESSSANNAFQGKEPGEKR